MRDLFDTTLAPLRMLQYASSGVRRENQNGILPGFLYEADHSHIRKDRREQDLRPLAGRHSEVVGKPRSEHGDLGSVPEEVALGHAHYLGEGLQETHVDTTTGI